MAVLLTISPAVKNKKGRPQSQNTQVKVEVIRILSPRVPPKGKNLQAVLSRLLIKLSSQTVKIPVLFELQPKLLSKKTTLKLTSVAW